MTTSDKADRKALPPPKRPARRRHRPPSTWRPSSDTEHLLADALARDARAGRRCRWTRHFFDDLGANSLLMAQFSALVRKETSTRLAVHAGDVRPPDDPAAGPAGRRRRAGRRTPTETGTVVRASTAGYWLVGCACSCCSCSARDPTSASLLLVTGLQLGVRRTHGPRGVRSVGGVRAGRFVVACLLPIPVKWLLIGRLQAAGDPPVEPGSLPVLAGQDADPGQPAGRCSPAPALPPLPARAGREDRSRGHHPVRHRAGGHRPDQHRRATPSSGATPRSPATGRCAGMIQIGPVDHRPRRVHRREDRAGHRHLDRRRRPARATPPRCRSGQRVPAGERWHGVPAEPTTWTTGWSRRPGAAAGGASVYCTLQLLSAFVIAPLTRRDRRQRWPVRSPSGRPRRACWRRDTRCCSTRPSTAGPRRSPPRCSCSAG